MPTTSGPRRVPDNLAGELAELFAVRYDLEAAGSYAARAKRERDDIGTADWEVIHGLSEAARKFDPDGVYIRRYLPELRRVPAERIHEPWKMTAAAQREAGCVLGVDYPQRIVLHGAARLEALRMYAAATQLAPPPV